MTTKPHRVRSEPRREGQFLPGSFTNEGGTRAYRLYIPGGKHAQALPLVVMLHGCGQDSDGFAAATRMNVPAEREKFFVLYPEQAAQANPSRCWHWYKGEDQVRGRGEPSIIAGMTREILSMHGIDAARVYVAGHSAGAAMAMVMGVNYPDLFAAIGVHSGLPYGVAHDLASAFAAMQQGPGAGLFQRESVIPPVLNMPRAVPAIVFHGDRDTTVHPGNGDQVLAQWAAVHSGGPRPLQLTTNRSRVPMGYAYTRAAYHDASGQALLEQWMVHGAGHGWSGGNPEVWYTEPRGPDASEEMVRFFRQHAQGEP